MRSIALALFAEFDGEGVAYAAPYFYVVGSHGCARKSGKLRLSSFILARIRVVHSGRPVDANGDVLDKDDMEGAVVETTYRVSDLLRRADTVGETFGKSLNTDDNGLNIEGITVDGDHVFFGLRAPVDGMAYIVEGSVSALFAPGRGQSSFASARPAKRDCAPMCGAPDRKTQKIKHLRGGDIAQRAKSSVPWRSDHRPR